MEKQIVEINGVKLEIDMRYAKRIDKFKIGDKVKLLKEKYPDDFRIHPGVIVGFENFKSLPSIIIAYLEIDYSGAKLLFEYFNAKSKCELVIAEDNYLPIEKATTLDQMDREILKTEEEVADLQRKKKFFLDNFEKYFSV
jgi:hypothetical protein